MRFYKEVWGFIFEFNSVGEYVQFLFGRLCGLIVLGVLFYLFFFS